VWECVSGLLGLVGSHTCQRALVRWHSDRVSRPAGGAGCSACMLVVCVCGGVGGGLVELVLSCFAGHGPYRWARGARRLPAGPSGISKHSSMHPAEQHPCSLTFITRAMFYSALPAFCGYNALSSTPMSLREREPVEGGGGGRGCQVEVEVAAAAACNHSRVLYVRAGCDRAVSAPCSHGMKAVSPRACSMPLNSSCAHTQQLCMKLIYLTQQIEGARPGT
jgi:hypothetical protein